MRRGNYILCAVACVAALAAITRPIIAGSLTNDNMLVGSNATVYGKLSIVNTTGSAPTNGLVLYYGFGTNSTPVADDAGNGHTGAVFGATWITNGITGGAYSFDGSDDYIQVPKAADLNITPRITVSFWMNFDTSSTAGMMPITKNDIGDTENTYWVVQIQAVSTPSRSFNWVVQFNVGGTGTATGDEWTHVAIVQSNNTATVYVNGRMAQTTSANSIPSCDKDILIGRRSGASAGYFKGKLDEIRIYNRPLSAAEIFGLYGNDAKIDNRVSIDGGIEYVAPLGELPMGSFTNSL